jgi:hypothetical protein
VHRPGRRSERGLYVHRTPRKRHSPIAGPLALSSAWQWISGGRAAVRSREQAGCAPCWGMRPCALTTSGPRSAAAGQPGRRLNSADGLAPSRTTRPRPQSPAMSRPPGRVGRGRWSLQVRSVPLGTQRARSGSEV